MPLPKMELHKLEKMQVWLILELCTQDFSTLGFELHDNRVKFGHSYKMRDFAKFMNISERQTFCNGGSFDNVNKHFNPEVAFFSL